jgi:hypothetical protein
MFPSAEEQVHAYFGQYVEEQLSNCYQLQIINSDHVLIYEGTARHMSKEIPTHMFSYEKEQFSPCSHLQLNSWRGTAQYMVLVCEGTSPHMFSFAKEQFSPRFPVRKRTAPFMWRLPTPLLDPLQYGEYVPSVHSFTRWKCTVLLSTPPACIYIKLCVCEINL